MSSDQNRYVPFGIENTLRALRAFDALSQRVAPVSVSDPEHCPPPPGVRGATQHAQQSSSAPHTERRGLTAEVLYDFFRGEFEQYERLAGLGFRYAESMLDLAERSTRGPAAEAYATQSARATELTIVSRSTDVAKGHIRVCNPTPRPVSFTLSISELRVQPDGVRHGTVRFLVDDQPVERVSVSPSGDAIVTFAVGFQPGVTGRVSGELYASGGGVHHVFPVLFVMGHT